MRVTVLGSGTSFGVPVVGCDCAVCNSSDSRDRRMRVSAVVEYDSGKRILIDTPPELRLQLVGNDIPTVDAVLYTHEHADHVHGIDDLRAISIRRTEDLPIYGPVHVLNGIESRFKYIFDESVVPPRGTSKPQLKTHAIEAGKCLEIAGGEVLPLEFSHGYQQAVFGYRFGDFAYVTDVKTVPDATLKALKGIRKLVLNGLFERPHPTHLSIWEACDVAAEVGAEETYITHLTHETGYADLKRRLPDGVEPAYDGLVIEL